MPVCSAWYGVCTRSGTKQCLSVEPLDMRVSNIQVQPHLSTPAVSTPCLLALGAAW